MVKTLAEAMAAGRPRDVPVPPELARDDHPGAHACRCRWSARSRSCICSGFSINTLTLFAIVLATGIVVDDAIVVIENIERHIQEYKKRQRDAASDAMREVFGAVLATALVLIAVFVPVAFFPGTTGRLYPQFALTIAFAVAMSAFNALTLTPALSALLLRHEGTARQGCGSSAPIERVIRRGTDFYVGVLSRLMRVRWAMVVVLLRACSGSRTSCINARAALVPAGGRSGLLHHDHPGAGRGVARGHRRTSRSEAETMLMKHAGGGSRCSPSWASASPAARRTRG